MATLTDSKFALHLDADDPWPGLASYDEASKDFFHGRDRDTTELLRLIRLSPFVALYGKSGLGKSSMLLAGLFPQLRATRFLPVHLRLDYTEKTAQPVLVQAVQRLQQEIEAAEASAEPLEDGETLWAYLQRREWPIWTSDNYPLTPVLVFDQFEEVFSRGGSATHVQGILDSLADLIGDRIPAGLSNDHDAARRLNLKTQQYRVVLSFRSDFLAEFESWEKQANLPRRESLHLMAMSRERAIEAVSRAGSKVLAPGVASEIVDFLLQREGANAHGRAVDVEPVLLSLCCYQLNRRRERPAPIDSALLRTVGEGILKGFYEEALAKMPPRVSVFIEERLIQGNRFRSNYPLEEALTSGALTQGELDHLTDSRLLRVDPQGDVPRIELIHDRLVGVVRDARDARLAREALEEQALEARAREEREKGEAELKAAQLREHETRRQAEAEKQRITRSRQILGLFVLVLVVALAGVGYSLWSILTEKEREDALQEALMDSLMTFKSQLEIEKLALVDSLKLLRRAASPADSALASSDASSPPLLGTAPIPAVTASRPPAPPAASPRVADVDSARTGAIPDPAVRPVRVRPSVPKSTEARGATEASSLTINGWALFSGGCSKQEVRVTGPLTVTIEPIERGVRVSERFEGRGYGYNVVLTGTKDFDKPQSSYLIDNTGTWSMRAGVIFRTNGVDAIAADRSGRPTSVRLRSIRTDCSGESPSK